MQNAGNQNPSGFRPVKHHMLALLHSPQPGANFIARPTECGFVSESRIFLESARSRAEHRYTVARVPHEMGYMMAGIPRGADFAERERSISVDWCRDIHDRRGRTADGRFRRADTPLDEGI
jgi:hypothetical protein